MVKLGQHVKDRVSGFEGIAIGKTTYLNGCDRILVQPKVKPDGTLPGKIPGSLQAVSRSGDKDMALEEVKVIDLTWQREVCEHCIFWIPVMLEEPNNDDIDREHGYCRRLPPAASDLSYPFLWLQTKACAEFKSNEKGCWTMSIPMSFKSEGKIEPEVIETEDGKKVEHVHIGPDDDSLLR
jgi:hypothetical protein